MHTCIAVHELYPTGCGFSKCAYSTVTPVNMHVIWCGAARNTTCPRGLFTGSKNYERFVDANGERSDC